MSKVNVPDFGDPIANMVAQSVVDDINLMSREEVLGFLNGLDELKPVLDERAYKFALEAANQRIKDMMN